jgi:hypothetical protein
VSNHIGEGREGWIEATPRREAIGEFTADLISEGTARALTAARTRAELDTQTRPLTGLSPVGGLVLPVPSAPILSKVSDLARADEVDPKIPWELVRHITHKTFQPSIYQSSKRSRLARGARLPQSTSATGPIRLRIHKFDYLAVRGKPYN